MTQRFRTALIGVGRIGATYADDPMTRRYFRYASHAQVLAEHRAFAWEAAVDPDPVALAHAQVHWRIAHAAPSIADLLSQYQPEVLVLAAPPSVRRSVIEACPTLKAVLCEKPLGETFEEATAFLNLCSERGVLVQVNLWRRCDPLTCRLADGALEATIGRPAIIHGLYGNGLVNNGTHLVDMCRMLFGEIVSVRALGPAQRKGKLPLYDDFDVTCLLRFSNGVVAVLQPLDFRHYREVGLDIWAENGRLEILNEGLVVCAFQRRPNRALSYANEVATDAPKWMVTTAGEALFHVYDNLASALRGTQELRSSGASAWRTAAVVETIRLAALAESDAEEAVWYDCWNSK